MADATTPVPGDETTDHPPKCDFCGKPSESVRRIALDGDYDRLRTRHVPRYACPECSERKDRERRAREG